MVRLRAEKVAGIAADIPELEVDDPDGADTLVLGWGSTLRRDRRGRASRAGERAQGRDGAPPLPEPVPAQHGRGRARATTRCSSRRSTSASCACSSAPSSSSTRSGYNKVRGRPFRAAELADAITALVDS